MTEPVRTLAARFLALFRRRSLDRDLDAELRSHLEMAIERNLGRGMSMEQARREALLGFGGLERTKQIYRERRGLPFIDTALQDIRFSFRMLSKSPGFTAVAVLTLALGIGSTTAIFSVVYGVLLRPLPYSDANRIMAIFEVNSNGGWSQISGPDFDDLFRQNHPLPSSAQYHQCVVARSRGAQPPRTQGDSGAPARF